MKKLFFMLMLCMGFGMAVTSCGDDDNDKTVTKSQVIEKGNQLILSFTVSDWGMKVEAEWVMTFDSQNLCEKAIITYKCNTPAVADKLYESLKLQEQENVTITKKGNTIVCDYSEEFAGMPKSAMRQMLEEIVKEQNKK